MKFLIFIYLLIGTIISAHAETPSHCTQKEKVVFNCQITGSSKVLSLCASKDLSDSSGYLQYRFGTLNKIELEFPGGRSNSQKRFIYSHYFRFQVDRTEIAFSNHGHDYTIYSYYEGDGEGDPVEEEGVRVDNINLRCAQPTNADFSLLDNSIPCDEGSAIEC